jgi:two-component system sensor histidine kinase/response regulator
MNDGSFDLVLMDAHMPEMDGLEATRLIRAHPEHGRVLIIGLTAEAFVNQHKALREAGMNAIVTKPFTDNDLISAIWANLEPGEAPADAPSEAPGEDDWKAEGEAGFKAFAEARDPAMIRKLLELGRKTTADRLRELQAAVAAGDSEQIRFSAHTIKGACGTMFAIKLSGLALEIEQVHEDIAAVAEKMPAVEACVRETIDWWAELADRL